MMYIQLYYLQLQKYIQQCLASTEPQMIAISNSLRQLEDFLNELELIIQMQAAAIFFELQFENTKKSIFEHVFKTNQQKAQKNMEAFFKKHAAEQSYDYKKTFTCIRHILLSDHTPEHVEIKKLVEVFHTALQTNISPSVLANTILTLIYTKLRASQQDNSLCYDPDLTLLRNRIQFIQDIKDDLSLRTLVESSDYDFSRQDLNKLDSNQYDLIKKYPVTRIFLLAGFKVTELDPPAMERTLENTKDLSAAEINAIVELAISTKRHLGLENYKTLLRCCYANKEPDFIKNIPAILCAANTIGSEARNTFSSFIHSLESCEKWESLSKTLPDLYASALDEATTPIDDQTIFDSYTTISRDVQAEFMPDRLALNKSIDMFKKIDQKKVDLRSKTDAQLKSTLHNAVMDYKSQNSEIDQAVLDDAEPTIWAVLREQFYRIYKIFPYSTQMINAHLILNTPHHKTVGQIKTGEGKSALQALMMVFNALTTGKKQFNITTANHLAERDMKKFSPFYNAFNLKCSANVSSNPKTSLHNKPIIYNTDIIYGTMSSFSFGFLYAILGHPVGLRQIFNHLDQVDVFVDEVDALMLDNNQSIAQITSAPGKTRDFNYRDGIYEAILDYIHAHRAPSHTEVATYSLNGFRTALIEQKLFTEEDMQDIKILLRTWQWYQSGISSLKYENGVHYVIEADPADLQKKKLTIVNRDTGELMHGREWSDGLHQILSLREGIPFKQETLIQACVAPHNLLNLFGSIFSITGTAGGEPCVNYLKQMYSGIEIMHLPRYRPSISHMAEHIISDNKQAQYTQLVNDINQAKKEGRPLLLLFDTIREVQEFSAYAKSQNCDVLQLTGNENESIENTLAIAGLPGSVLVATFLAGRGADITPSPEAEKNGGLGVYLCTPPENARVMWQNFGRTGRQGRGGFYAFRFNQKELMLKISMLESRISDTQKLIGEDNPELKLSLRVWEIPYQKMQTQNTQRPLPALTPEILRETNESIREAQANSLTRKNPALTKDGLLKKWETLLDKSEKMVNDSNIYYGRYVDLAFYFQKFVYDTRDETWIDEQFVNYYALVDINLQDAFYERKINAFELLIGQYLVEMGKAVNEKVWTIEKLRSHAEKTDNPLMTICLNRAYPPLTAHDSISKCPDSFFTQLTQTSASPISLTSSANVDPEAPAPSS